MGFRLRKRIKIAPGLHINLSKSGVSTSIGKPGATVNIGKKGVKATIGIPGSGLSYSQNLTNGVTTEQSSKKSSLLSKLILGLFLLFVISAFLDKSPLESASYKTVEAKSLRVRTEPSTDSDVINQLKFGDRVQVKQTQNGWSLVESKQIKGWVASKYLADQ